MISIARIFGAPVRVPAGNVAASAPTASFSGARVPFTREAIRRGAEDRAVRRTYEILIGRRADPAEGSVDGEGIAHERRRPAARDDDLEDIARADVLLCALDALEELQPRESLGPGRSRA